MSTPPAPPKTLKDQLLKTIEVDPSALYRVSRYSAGEPFFGKSASNRFDDPLKKFGTCYLGHSLECAIAETVLHDLMPVKGQFHVPLAELESRHLVQFKGPEKLTLVDLTGAHLKVLVGTSAICTVTPYDVPQQWARAIHRHPQRVDGIQFVSRQLNDQRAVVIFHRARHKLQSPRYTPLLDAKGALAAISTLHISVRN